MQVAEKKSCESIMFLFRFSREIRERMSTIWRGISISKLHKPYQCLRAFLYTIHGLDASSAPLLFLGVSGELSESRSPEWISMSEVPSTNFNIPLINIRFDYDIELLFFLSLSLSLFFLPTSIPITLIHSTSILILKRFCEIEPLENISQWIRIHLMQLSLNTTLLLRILPVMNFAVKYREKWSEFINSTGLPLIS